MRGHCKGQSQVHTAGVVFHRKVDKIFQPGKLDNMIKPLFDIFARDTQDGTVQENVFTA